MRLSDERFEKLEKYVVVRVENYNSDRCLVVPVEGIIKNGITEATMCMNEWENEVHICQVNGKNVTEE